MLHLTHRELIEFVVESAGRLWATNPRGRRFTLESMGKGKGLLVTLAESGSTRAVSDSAIKEFCNGFSSGGRTKKAVGGGYNTSYLFPVAIELLAEMGRAARFEVLPLADEVPVAEYREGATRSVVVNWYERSPEARRACILSHGTNCAVCGFDFGAVYGEEAKGVIHVHHLNPLALSQGEYLIDPVKDLRPVCPNCHAVIRRPPAFSSGRV